MIYGRSVEAYRIKENPSLIVLRILQNDSDCPERFTAGQRRNCVLDCVNSYMAFVYDSAKRDIVGEGRLAVNYLLFEAEFQLKHDLNITEIIPFMTDNVDEIECSQYLNQRVFRYNGDVIARQISCAFILKEDGYPYTVIPYTPEQKTIAKLVRKKPMEIIDQCNVVTMDMEELTESPKEDPIFPTWLRERAIITT